MKINENNCPLCDENTENKNGLNIVTDETIKYFCDKCKEETINTALKPSKDTLSIKTLWADKIAKRKSMPLSSGCVVTLKAYKDDE
jgi:hypothetical protein